MAHLGFFNVRIAVRVECCLCPAEADTWMTLEDTWDEGLVKTIAAPKGWIPGNRSDGVHFCDDCAKKRGFT